MTPPFILLVEDNPDDAALTSRVLRRIGNNCDVVLMADGVEALDFLFAQGMHCGREPHDLPKVVLLDLNLPKLDGRQVLQAIRARDLTRYLPVVMLTSSDEYEDVAGGYRCGANSYVVKPVSFDDFVQTVRHLGLYWVDLNQPSVAAGLGPEVGVSVVG